MNTESQTKFIDYLLSNEFDKCTNLLSTLKTVNYGNSFQNCKAKQAQTLMNATIAQTRNPLITMSYMNNLLAVQFLVEKCNADINYISYNNTTAIMFAFQQGNVEIVAYLLSKNAAIETNTLTKTHHVTDYCNTTHIANYMDLMNFLLMQFSLNNKPQNSINVNNKAVIDNSNNQNINLDNQVLDKENVDNKTNNNDSNDCNLFDFSKFTITDIENISPSDELAILNMINIDACPEIDESNLQLSLNTMRQRFIKLLVVNAVLGKQRDLVFNKLCTLNKKKIDLSNACFNSSDTDSASDSDYTDSASDSE